MTIRNLLLAAHILFAILLLGPLAASAATASSIVRRGPDALPIARWNLKLDELLGTATLVIPVTGLVLVAREEAYRLGQAWIVAGIVLYVAAAVLGAVGMGGALRSAIAKLEAGESVTAEAARLRLLGAVALAIDVALVWVMVAKPGL